MSSSTTQLIETPAGAPAEEVATTLTDHKRIARLAYSYWEARGRPHGSPEEDWFRAEEELRRRKSAFKVVKEARHHLPHAPTSSRSRKTAG